MSIDCWFNCRHILHNWHNMAILRYYLHQDYTMKLPKPIKRGDAYRISIMIDGERASATFDTEKECTQWAAKQKLKATAGEKLKTHRKTSITVHELMTLHYANVRAGSKGEDYDVIMQRVLPRDHSWLTQMMVVDVTALDLTKYRDMRLKLVKSATVKRELGYLSGIFTHAVKDLFIIDANPCHSVNKPPDGKDRFRRITADEVDAVLDLCQYKLGVTPTTSRQYVAWSFLWGLESAMRRNEILGMTWLDVHTNHVHLPTSKTDKPRNVPLSPTMRKLLSCLPTEQGALIPINRDAFKSAWKRVKADLNKTVDDLQFRDTRHEAISRMVNSKRLPVEQLAKITGHTKLETLLNVYYNPTADELYNSMYGEF